MGFLIYLLNCLLEGGHTRPEVEGKCAFPRTLQI